MLTASVAGLRSGAGGPAYRACAAADRTGLTLLHTLHQQALRAGVTFLAEWIALDLLMSAQGTCLGALVWHIETGTLHVLRSHALILATGGYGQAYAATTSSSFS